MKKPKKGLGITSMVLGIISLSIEVVALIEFVRFHPLHLVIIPTALIGLALGIIAVIKKQGRIATAGLVMNAIIALLSTIVLLLLAAASAA